MAPPRRAANAPCYWKNDVQTSDQPPGKLKSHRPRSASESSAPSRSPTLTSRFQQFVFMQIRGSLRRVEKGELQAADKLRHKWEENKTGTEQRRGGERPQWSLKMFVSVTIHHAVPLLACDHCCIGVLSFPFQPKTPPSISDKSKITKPLNNYASHRLAGLYFSLPSLRGSDLRCGCDTGRRLTPRRGDLAECSGDSEWGRPDALWALCLFLKRHLNLFMVFYFHFQPGSMKNTIVFLKKKTQKWVEPAMQKTKQGRFAFHFHDVI